MGDRSKRKRYGSERGGDGGPGGNGARNKKKSYGTSSNNSVHFLTHTTERRSKIMGAEYMIPGAGRSMNIGVQQLLPSHLLNKSLNLSSLSDRMEAWKKYRMHPESSNIQDQQQHESSMLSGIVPIVESTSINVLPSTSLPATDHVNDGTSIVFDGMTLIERDVVRQSKRFINAAKKISDTVCLSSTDLKSLQECLLKHLKRYSSSLIEFAMSTPIFNRDESRNETEEEVAAINTSDRTLELQIRMAAMYQKTILSRGSNVADHHRLHHSSKRQPCFFIVGPSGCGKTSIINSIFETSQLTLWHAGLLDNGCSLTSVKDSIGTMFSSCTSVLIDSSRRHIWRPVIIKDVDSIVSLTHWTSSDCKLLIDFLSKLIKNLTSSISDEINKSNNKSPCCRIPVIVFVVSSTRSAYVRQLMRMVGVERETIVRIEGRCTNQSRLEWVIGHPLQMKMTYSKIGISPPANNILQSLLVPSSGNDDRMKGYFNDTHESLPMTSWIIHLCWQMSIVDEVRSHSDSVERTSSCSSTFNMKRDLFKIMVWVHNVSPASFETRWNNILLAIPLNSLTRQIVLRSLSCCLSNNGNVDESSSLMKRIMSPLEHHLFLSDMNFFGESDGVHGDSLGIKSSYACALLHCWLKSSESTINPKNFYDSSGTVWLQEYSSSSSSSFPSVKRVNSLVDGDDPPPPRLSPFTRSSFELDSGKFPSDIDCSNTHSSDGNFNLFTIYSSTPKTAGALEPFIYKMKFR